MMVDEYLRKPRRKAKGKLHLLESPFPIPIQTITGKKSSDKHWYYYFGTLESDHVSISRLGDLTFLYRLGFFGKGVYSRSQPQFEKYKDVLSDQGRKYYMRNFSLWEPEDRDPMQHVYADITSERLRQHASWIQNEVKLSEIQTGNETKDGEVGSDILDGALLQCSDLHTDMDNMLVEECSSESEDVDLDVIPSSAEKDLGRVVCLDKETNVLANENDDVASPERIIDCLASDKISSTDNLVLDAEDAQDSRTTEILTEDDKTRTKEISEEKECKSVEEHTDGSHIINPCTKDIDEVDIKNMSCKNRSLKRPLAPPSETVPEKNIKLEDSYKLYECVQLTFEEAFFLSYGLGCLAVTDNNNHNMNLTEMWNTFSSKQTTFIPMYAAYHHFRSKGWVVRFSKIYGLDFVLYQDGMAFHHASYSVIVNFVEEENFSQNKQQLSWKKLMSMCRINERAGKEVLFCYVVRPRDMTEEDLKSPSCIKRFKIMEVVMRRWLPEKFRECKD